MTESFLQIKNMCFGYDEKVIFKDLSLDIPKNKIVAIMGPSGTGKTTLLKLLGGQLFPFSGSVHFKNQNIHQLNRRQLFTVRKEMALLFQSSALFTDLTVFENVAFPLRENTHLPEAVIKNLVMMKLELVGLRGAAFLMAAQLSAGMARRVALARSIVMDPQLMMYDEPFTGLDPISKAVILKLIKELNQALNMTSIIVTHDVYDVMKIADEIYILSEGCCLEKGSPKEITETQNPAVKQFICGLPDGQVPFHYSSTKTFYQELSEC